MVLLFRVFLVFYALLVQMQMKVLYGTKGFVEIVDSFNPL